MKESEGINTNKAQSIKNLVTRQTCRICDKSNMELILSLGDMCIINFIDDNESQIFKAPLDLVYCNKKNGGYGLLQLRHTVPGDILYKKFWYKSGVNQTMRDELSDIRSEER